MSGVRRRKNIIKNIVKRDGSIVKYDRMRIRNAILKALIAGGKPDSALANKLALQVEESLIHTYGDKQLPTVEDIQDIVENVLMENKLPDIARRYIIYRHEHALMREAKAYEVDIKDTVPYRKLYEILKWNVEHEADSIEKLNRLIARGKFLDLILASEERYHKEIGLAAAMVLANINKIKVVIIAGPSSSGKTTTTIKLGEILTKEGISFKTLNIDNYFFDLELHPKDEFGDYDYERPEAIDMELVNKHLELLLDGQKIWIPKYDFKTGKRIMNYSSMKLGKKDILLIDCLHGLNNSLTRSVPEEYKLKLYVETLGQLRCPDGTIMRWADNRLIRRMVRDSIFRNSKPLRTLTHWHYVRRSELQYIIPYIKDADVIINTALAYELPILKAKIFRKIAPAIKLYADDPARLDAFIRVNRIYDLLKPLKSISDDSCVPVNSLLREFIGGSCYRY